MMKCMICTLIFVFGFLGCPNPEPQLFANVWPPNGGTVTLQPTGRGQYELLAQANSGWQFDHWNGPVTEPLAEQTTATLTQDSLCQAVFFGEVDPLAFEGLRQLYFAGMEWTVRQSDALTTPAATTSQMNPTASGLTPKACI